MNDSSASANGRSIGVLICDDVDEMRMLLSMPHKTGFEALPEIRQVAPTAQVIVLSGLVASTIAADVLARGAARFIEKGADPDVIFTVIEEVAAQRTSHHS